jgi:hypothetical protein
MNERNSRRALAPVLFGVACLALWAVAANAAEPLSKRETARLREMGTKVFGIHWARTVHGAQERGVIVVTDGRTTLTRRGARTFIIHEKKATAGEHDKKATAAGDEKTFAGTDDELKRRGIRILEAIGAKSSDVLETRVLQQMTQAVYQEPGREAKPEPARKGRRTLLVTRQVDGIRVPSSRLLLDLGANGRIVFMELTWPEISKETVETARRLQEVSRREYQPPAMEAATVESVQPVVLHSPAVGFFDDQVAALQVIYKPDRAEVGKKPVRYVDAEGRDVKLPRQMEALKDEPVQRKGAAASEK